jgi:hypothetical protein
MTADFAVLQSALTFQKQTSQFFYGATTFSIKTFSITTLSITTLGIMTLSIKTPSIMTLSKIGLIAVPSSTVLCYVMHFYFILSVALLLLL